MDLSECYPSILRDQNPLYLCFKDYDFPIPENGFRYFFSVIY